jgi:hypothetical protein
MVYNLMDSDVKYPNMKNIIMDEITHGRKLNTCRYKDMDWMNYL